MLRDAITSIRDSFIFRSIISFILVLTLFPATSYAEEKTTYEMPNEAISKEAHDRMISVTTKDVKGYEAISSWLLNQETYIFVKNTDGKISYYLNTPNLQRGIYNSIQQVNKGGWVSETYNKNANEYTDDGEWTTAAKKYGYLVPHSVYIGEYPVVTINLAGIADDAFSPLNKVKVTFSLFVEGLWSAGSWVAGLFGINTPDFNTEFTAGLTPSSISSMSYANSDYENTTQDYVDRLAQWLKDNWAIWVANKEDAGAKIDGKNIFDDGVVIKNAEYRDIEPRNLLSLLIDKTGVSYDAIIKGLDAYNREKGLTPAPTLYTIRDMPYDINSMSKQSREYMHNISDPRFEMFNNTGPLGVIGTTTSQIMYNMVGSHILSWTAAMSYIGAKLNSICDLTMLSSNGFSPIQFWEGSIGQFILLAVLVAAILFIVISMIKSVTTGRTGTSSIISKVIMTSLMAALTVGILVAPKQAGDTIINVTSKILSIGTVTMNSESFNKMYTPESTDGERSELRYWYMYHSIWSQYVTNHQVTDEANKFDISQNTNEYTGLEGSPAKLAGNTPINLWSVAMLDAQQSNNSNFLYRGTDHFMAPTITDTGYPTFDVTENKYYNGHMFSNIPFGGLFAVAAVLIMTFMKLLCFIELVVDIMFLFIRFVIGAFEGRAFILDGLKSIGNDILRVIAYDMFITMFIYTTTTTTGLQLTILALTELAFTIFLIGYLANHNSYLLCPGTLVSIQSATSRAFRIVKKNAGYDEIDDELKKNKEALAEIRARYYGSVVCDEEPSTNTNDLSGDLAGIEQDGLNNYNSDGVNHVKRGDRSPVIPDTISNQYKADDSLNNFESEDEHTDSNYSGDTENQRERKRPTKRSNRKKIDLDKLDNSATATTNNKEILEDNSLGNISKYGNINREDLNKNGGKMNE